MIKKIISLFFILMLVGCASKRSDYYFDKDKGTNTWSHEFIPGKDDTKRMGYPDSVLFTLEKNNYQLDAKVLSYQDLDAIGAILIPIIPVFGSPSYMVTVAIDIKTDEPLDMNVKDWKLVDLKTNKQYNAQSVSIKRYGENKTMNINKVGKYYVSFPVSVSELRHFKLEFGTITIGNKKEIIPPIYLQKKRGDTRFSQFTV